MKKVDFYNLPEYNSDDIKYYVIVFTEDSFKNKYSVEQRSYAFSTDNKWFKPYMIGNSLFSYCLDGHDRGVRLDWYFGDWKIEYCYEITEEEFEKILSRFI